MTKEQRKFVFQIADEIKWIRGERFEVRASFSIVRIEDARNRKNYRLMTPLDGDDYNKIRQDMMKLVDQLEGEKK